MATIFPQDDQTVTLGSLSGRCLVSKPTQPRSMPLMWFRTPEPGVPKTLMFFGVQQDACCGEDNFRNPRPNRSMFGMEQNGFKPWDGVKRRVEFDLIVVDGPPLSTKRWEWKGGAFMPNALPAFFLVHQWQTFDKVKRTGFSPPTEIGLKQVGANLCLDLKVHIADPDSKPLPWMDVQGPVVPIARGSASHSIAAEMLDSHGQPGGSFTVWLNGKVVWDYHGPVGYPGHGNSWASCGAYRSNAPEEVRLRIASYREGPVGQMLAA